MIWSQEDRVWLASVLEECSFGDWEFVIGGDSESGLYLQAGFGDGEPSTPRARKWPLLPTMSRTEIVHTAFTACMHELQREAHFDFHYRGRPIFAPLFDVERLARLADDSSAIDPGRVRK